MSLRKIVIGAVLVIVGLPVALVLVAVVTSFILNRTSGTIVSSGEKREYLLYVPRSYDAVKPTPLVISLHGAATWPAQQMNTSWWNRLADEHGFIVVYPSGSDVPRIWHVERGAGLERDVRFISDLIDRLDRVFATKTRDEWAVIFDRYELIWAPVRTLLEASRDPQALALGMFEKVHHRTGREISLVRSPVDFSVTPATIRSGAPELGEHTEEVLLAHGYGWEDIAKLREKGVFG